mmetsp:Transcript_17319/g.48703  ORF Transcript_17319/g.48703 Transcript_17319/m.48703 type:complete len:393 (-) Transcript_17319:296-1474(-)
MCTSPSTSSKMDGPAMSSSASSFTMAKAWSYMPAANVSARVAADECAHAGYRATKSRAPEVAVVALCSCRSSPRSSGAVRRMRLSAWAMVLAKAESLSVLRDSASELIVSRAPSSAHSRRTTSEPRRCRKSMPTSPRKRSSRDVTSRLNCKGSRAICVCTPRARCTTSSVPSAVQSRSDGTSSRRCSRTASRCCSSSIAIQSSAAICVSSPQSPPRLSCSCAASSTARRSKSSSWRLEATILYVLALACWAASAMLASWWLMQGSRAATMDGRCGASSAGASCTNSCSQWMAVNCGNSSLLVALSTSVPVTRAKSTGKPPWISCRNSLSTMSACCLISRDWSLSMPNRPSASSGRYSSMLMSGTLSRAVSQPMRNWRTYGLATCSRTRSSGT